MKYSTTEEWMHFNFEGAEIAEVSFLTGQFSMAVNGAKILPENSCNRDIRVMGSNGLQMKFVEGKVTAVVEEAYKVFDPDGKLLELHKDLMVAPEQFADKIKEFEGCTLYSIEKEGEVYKIEIDSEDRAYRIEITGGHDEEEWDRFVVLG